MPHSDLTIKKKSLIVDEYLGRGTTSTVYKGTWKEKSVVVKDFRSEYSYLIQREIDNLEIVAKFGGSVPKVESVVDQGCALITVPVGIHFAISEKEYKSGKQRANR